MYIAKITSRNSTGSFGNQVNLLKDTSGTGRIETKTKAALLLSLSLSWVRSIGLLADMAK